MSALWFIVAFLLGALFWYWAGSFMVKRVLRRNDTFTDDILSGLPQKSLISVYRKSEAEIERRKKGLE